MQPRRAQAATDVSQASALDTASVACAESRSLGSYVSRAIARREIAGLWPGFWPQSQSNPPTPS